MSTVHKGASPVDGDEVLSRQTDPLGKLGLAHQLQAHDFHGRPHALPGKGTGPAQPVVERDERTVAGMGGDQPAISACQKEMPNPARTNRTTAQGWTR
jgi:hypothetical protein